MSDRASMPGSLAEFLRAYLYPTPDPTDESAAQSLATARGCSIESARGRLKWIYQIRSLVEDYIGREIGDEHSIRVLFARLARDFGVPAIEFNRLHPTYLIPLLVNLGRWNVCGAEERQALLRKIEDAREAERMDPKDPASSPIFLKAMERFPAPEAISAAEPSDSAPRSEPEGTETRATNTPELPDEPPPDPDQTRSLADRLRTKHPRAGIQAALLEYMDERSNAPFPEIADRVHGDPQTSDLAIRANVGRVNAFLEREGLSIRFRVGSGRVIKEETNL